MGKVFIVKPDTDWQAPEPLQPQIDAMRLIVASHEDIVHWIEELDYVQRPDSSAINIVVLLEEMIDDIMLVLGHEYEGRTKYEIKRLLRQGYKTGRLKRYANISTGKDGESEIVAD